MTIRDSFLQNARYATDTHFTTEFAWQWGTPLPLGFLSQTPTESPSPGDDVISLSCDYCKGTHYYKKKPSRISCYGCGAHLHF